MKRSLVKAVMCLPKVILCNAIDGWLQRLSCVKPRGGHLENDWCSMFVALVGNPYSKEIKYKETFHLRISMRHSNLSTSGRCPLLGGRLHLCGCVCLFSIANPLHYYMLRVPHRADRWHWVWSIFESRTAWADHITCGMSICKVYFKKLRLG